MKRLVTILKNPWITRIYLTILLVWVSYFFYLYWEDFLKIFSTSEPLLLFGALFSYSFVVCIINPYLHGIAYREIGANISFWQTFRIFHLSRIGNYLPGRIWFATNYYIFSKKLDIDTEKIAKNFIMMNICLFLVGSICSFQIVSLLHPVTQKLLIIFPILLMFLIHPRIFNKALSPLLGKNVGKDYRYIFLVKICILYFIAYIILGVELYLCISTYTAVDISNFPLIVASSASSLVIGLLAIFAPVGIGVNEGINVTILSQIIPLEIAIAAVIVLRLMRVLVDISCALVSAVSVTREEKAKDKNKLRGEWAKEKTILKKENHDYSR